MGYVPYPRTEELRAICEGGFEGENSAAEWAEFTRFAGDLLLEIAVHKAYPKAGKCSVAMRQWTAYYVGWAMCIVTENWSKADIAKHVPGAES